MGVGMSDLLAWTQPFHAPSGRGLHAGGWEAATIRSWTSPVGGRRRCPTGGFHLIRHGQCAGRRSVGLGGRARRSARHVERGRGVGLDRRATGRAYCRRASRCAEQVVRDYCTGERGGVRGEQLDGIRVRGLIYEVGVGGLDDGVLEWWVMSGLGGLGRLGVGAKR